MKTQGWHVVFVKSHHEKKVDTRLKQLNIDSFLPTVSTLRQWSDRKKKVTVPLFPGYVFVNIGSTNDYGKALSVSGVLNFLYQDSKFALVKENEMINIQRILKLNTITDIEATSLAPKVGDSVKITEGPLQGVECHILNTNNKNRILVSIQSIQQAIMASVPSSYLSLC
jgi:transcriptional antiterminator RfaH